MFVFRAFGVEKKHILLIEDGGHGKLYACVATRAITGESRSLSTVLVSYNFCNR